MARKHAASNGVAELDPIDALLPEIVVPTMIVKRDGRVVPFDASRIESALTRCFASFGRAPETSIDMLSSVFTTPRPLQQGQSA